MAATGQDNPSADAQLGSLANWYKNAYSQGGQFYNASLLDQAGRASGFVQPPMWTIIFRRDGKVVDGKWQWDPSTYPDLVALKGS